MITKKTDEEIETLSRGGLLLREILQKVALVVSPGVSAFELDRMAEKLIAEARGEPSFKGYNPYGAAFPYPTALCVSINDEVVHAIPKADRILKEGDIVSLDIGMWWPSRVYAKEVGVRPMATDTAITVGVGKISAKAEKLIRITRESLDLGIKVVKDGVYTGDIGAAIQEHIEKHNFGVVRDLAGHGVGYKVHEDPYIPNYGEKGKGTRLEAGMVIAIEPMATEGACEVKIDEDEWAFRTKDGKLAAHFEHTVAIMKNGARVIT